MMSFRQNNPNERMKFKKKCDKCPYELGDTEFKPSLYFKAQRPRKIKVLFIAESPPGLRKGLEKDLQHYFYNENFKTTGNTLRGVLLEVLEISDKNPLQELEKFRDEGYFLIDTIKCRVSKKEIERRYWKDLVKDCASTHLLDEIIDLEPEKICLLGQTALEGVKTLHGFGALRKHDKISKCVGKVEYIKIKDRSVKLILSFFPRPWFKDEIRKLVVLR